MRRTRLAAISLVTTMMLVGTGCTPEQLEGIGRTIGTVILLLLWGTLPPHPGGV